jgi:transmembrane sensor
MTKRAGEDSVDRALAFVRPAWTPQRAGAVGRAVGKRVVRRARARRAATAALGLCLFAGVAWQTTIRVGQTGTRPAPELAEVAPPAEASPAPLRLPDGSLATLIGAGSEVRLVERSPRRQVVRVLAGGARFRVTKRKEQVFRVEIRDVAVEVLGTVFSAKAEGERVRVTVDEGRVRVAWAGRAVLLGDGESALFPPLEDPADLTTEPAPPAAITPPAPERARAAPPRAAPAAIRAARAPRAWRALAERGRFDEAYGALDGAVPDEPQALLLAADVARRSHHHAEAVPYLRRLLERHPRDPRAPLAAFTLGLVSLEHLGDPRAAARAFADARRLDPAGDLAEDALAREVEAWRRAGDGARAAARAREYVARHPAGRRTAAVTKFGGLGEAR